MKYTPGPWHVGIKPGPMIYNQYGDQIADMHDPLPCIDNLVNKANARLIAAAPDLLEALEHVVRWFDQINPIDVERYRAAIKKATE
jgi:hypothetical protein